DQEEREYVGDVGLAVLTDDRTDQDTIDDIVERLGEGLAAVRHDLALGGEQEEDHEDERPGDHAHHRIGDRHVDAEAADVEDRSLNDLVDQELVHRFDGRLFRHLGPQSSSVSSGTLGRGPAFATASFVIREALRTATNMENPVPISSPPTSPI